MNAFVTSDFSVANVYNNSHSLKPMLYKISGVWGNHEGSLLLWVTVMALFGALVAVFGAVLGVSVGLLFGWAVVQAMPASFASAVAIPVQPIAVLVVVAALAGVVAALLPARRAARLDVLDAIAH